MRQIFSWFRTVKQTIEAIHTQLTCLSEDVALLKQDQKRMNYLAHGVDQIFAMQGTISRQESNINELHRLALLAESRRLRRHSTRLKQQEQPQHAPQEQETDDLHSTEEAESDRNRYGQWKEEVSNLL